MVQEFVDWVGVGWVIVVCICQGVGYWGYLQLCVVFVVEFGSVFGEVVVDYGFGVFGCMWGEIDCLVGFLLVFVSLFDLDVVVEVVCFLVFVCCLFVFVNGLLLLIVNDFVMRLIVVGWLVEFIVDVIVQQIVVCYFIFEDVCFVVSGLGVNEVSLRVVMVVVWGGVMVIVLILFVLFVLIEVVLLLFVIVLIGVSFCDEFEYIFCVVYFVFVEVFVVVVIIE